MEDFVFLKKYSLVMLILLITISLAFFSVSCEKQPSEREHLLIVTTIYPYEIIVRQLALDNAEVLSIIPPSASPHSYSPRPEDIKKIEDADLVISNGANLELYLGNALDTLGEKHIDAFSLISDLVYFSHDHDNDNNDHVHTSCSDVKHDEHHSADHHSNPHIWLDPILVNYLASNIISIFHQLDPENESLYNQNLKTFSADLMDLHSQIVEERKEFTDINVLNFHNAFHYFNKRYDIHSAGVIVHSPGKEPTASELVQIGEQIKSNNVQVIFTEPQLNPKAAQVIADEFQLNVDLLDPIGNKNNAQTITSLIKHNWEVIKRNLSIP